MIQPATAQRLTPSVPQPTGSQGTGAPGGFADSLALVLDAAAVATAPPAVVGGATIDTPVIGLADPARQPVADPGKALPVDPPALFAVIGIAAPVVADGASPIPADALAPAAPSSTDTEPARADPIVVAARGTSALTPLPIRPAQVGKIAETKGNVSIDRSIAKAKSASVAPPMPGPAPFLVVEPADNGDGQKAESESAPDTPRAGADTAVPPAIVAMPPPLATPIDKQPVETDEGTGNIGGSDVPATAPMVAAGAPMLQVAAAIMAAMPGASPLTGTVETLPSRDLVPLPTVPAPVIGSVPVEARVPIVVPVVAPIFATPTPLATTLPLMVTTGTMPAFVTMQSVDATPPPPPVPTDTAPRWTPPTDVAALPLVGQQVATSVQPQPGTVASAAQVFGAAIQAATRRRDDPASPTDIGALGAVAAPLTTHAVTQVADAQQAPLDMRQERWPHAMIERIDSLRDAANATDTRIRLIPDALGTIDVSVQRDGDTVRVHFNAEQAQTRTLLQDAQPRLAELAEARGIKLTQAGVAGSGLDTGTNAGTNQQRQPTTPQPRMPTAPARVRAVADTDSTATRLA